MRSALDPVPRFISVKSLAILVAMLLSGIAISVREYLESGRIPHRACSCDAALKEGSSPRGRCPETRAVPAFAPGNEENAPDLGAIPSGSQPAQEPTSPPSAPGIWAPDSSGSVEDRVVGEAGR